MDFFNQNGIIIWFDLNFNFELELQVKPYLHWGLLFYTVSGKITPMFFSAMFRPTISFVAVNLSVMFTKTASPDMWMGFLRAYYHEETIMLTVHRAESNGKGNIYSYEIFHNQVTVS